MLLFPKPSSLKDIYREPKLNNKSGLYGTGILGPPHLFSTLDGEEHRTLRKALGGSAVCLRPPLDDWRFTNMPSAVVNRFFKEKLGAKNG
jgi:hypothetical protein